MLQARRILRLKAEPLENLSVDQIHDKFIHEKLKMVIKIKRKREKEGFLPFGIFAREKWLSLWNKRMFLQDIWQETSEEYHKLHEVKSLNIKSSAAKQGQKEFNTTCNR